MQEINDFYNVLNFYLSKQENIQQCIIKDYAVTDDKTLATCTALVANTNENSIKEYKNVACFVGSAVDIEFENYMSGILLKMQKSYINSQDISDQKLFKKYPYFNMLDTSLIAIAIPTSETLDNILKTTIKAKEQANVVSPKIYLGSEEVNVLNEISEYLNELKGFFDKFAQNAPTLAAQPGPGSAQMQTASQQMSQKTQEIYDKITEIVKTELESSDE